MGNVYSELDKAIKGVLENASPIEIAGKFYTIEELAKKASRQQQRPKYHPPAWTTFF